MSDEVLAVVTPSPARRWLAVGMMLGLGGLLVYLSLSAPPQTMGLRIFMLAVGIGALILADKVRRATTVSIELTEAGLRDSAGTKLCDFDDIEAVERGAFAFKPSNGFLVRLKTRSSRAWQPGLWWRFGKRIGVGGVTPASQSKFMADMIAMRLKGMKNLLQELGIEMDDEGDDRDEDRRK